MSTSTGPPAQAAEPTKSLVAAAKGSAQTPIQIDDGSPVLTANSPVSIGSQSPNPKQVLVSIVVDKDKNGTALALAKSVDGKNTDSYHDDAEDAEVDICTACGECFVDDVVRTHPYLGVAICTECLQNLQDAASSKGSPPVVSAADGTTKQHSAVQVAVAEAETEPGSSDDFCSWCGLGGDLVLCDQCYHCFCQDCLARNLGPAEFERILDADAWVCFRCDPKPIAQLRTACERLLRLLEEGEQPSDIDDADDSDATVNREDGNGKIDGFAGRRAPSQSAVDVARQRGTQSRASDSDDTSSATDLPSPVVDKVLRRLEELEDDKDELLAQNEPDAIDSLRQKVEQELCSIAAGQDLDDKVTSEVELHQARLLNKIDALEDRIFVLQDKLPASVVAAFYDSRTKSGRSLYGGFAQDEVQMTETEKRMYAEVAEKLKERYEKEADSLVADDDDENEAANPLEAMERGIEGADIIHEINTDEDFLSGPVRKKYGTSHVRKLLEEENKLYKEHAHREIKLQTFAERSDRKKESSQRKRPALRRRERRIRPTRVAPTEQSIRSSTKDAEGDDGGTPIAHDITHRPASSNQERRASSGSAAAGAVLDQTKSTKEFLAELFGDDHACDDADADDDVDRAATPVTVNEASWKAVLNEQVQEARARRLEAKPTYSRIKEEARTKTLQQRARVASKKAAEADKNAGASSTPHTDEKLLVNTAHISKDEPVFLHETLAMHFKPHQIEGLQFMWNHLFEATKQDKTISAIDDDGRQIQLSAGNGCILAHSMGLGKSLQILALLYTAMTHKRFRHVCKTTLILAPVNTLANWREEFKKWVPSVPHIPFYTATATNLQQRVQILVDWYRTGGVCVMGHDMYARLTNPRLKRGQLPVNIRELMEALLINPGPDIVIADEAHVFSGNSETLVYESFQKLATTRVVLATGTPLQNHLKEYYAMVHLIRPGILRTPSWFKYQFISPIIRGQYDDSTEADKKYMRKRLHVLTRMMDHFVHRRYAKNLHKGELPERHEFAVFVSMSQAQHDMYHLVVNDLKTDFGKNIVAVWRYVMPVWTDPSSIMPLVNKALARGLSDEEPPKAHMEALKRNLAMQFNHTLKQCQGVPVTQRSGKFAFANLLIRKAISNGDRLLIFCERRFVMDTFEDLFSKTTWPAFGSGDEASAQQEAWKSGVHYFRIDGTVSDSQERLRMCKRFNSSDKSRVFLISYKAGCTGINLTGANHVLLFDTIFNPATEEQAIFRSYRFGQKKPVFVYRLIAGRTLDHYIYNKQTIKKVMQRRVVEKESVACNLQRNDMSPWTIHLDDSQLTVSDVESDEEEDDLKQPSDVQAAASASGATSVGILETERDAGELFLIEDDDDEQGMESDGSEELPSFLDQDEPEPPVAVEPQDKDNGPVPMSDLPREGNEHITNPRSVAPLRICNLTSIVPSGHFLHGLFRSIPWIRKVINHKSVIWEDELGQLTEHDKSQAELEFEQQAHRERDDTPSAASSRSANPVANPGADPVASLAAVLQMLQAAGESLAQPLATRIAPHAPEQRDVKPKGASGKGQARTSSNALSASRSDQPTKRRRTSTPSGSSVSLSSSASAGTGISQEQNTQSERNGDMHFSSSSLIQGKLNSR